MALPLGACSCRDPRGTPAGRCFFLVSLCRWAELTKWDAVTLREASGTGSEHSVLGTKNGGQPPVACVCHAAGGLLSSQAGCSQGHRPGSAITQALHAVSYGQLQCTPSCPQEVYKAPVAIGILGEPPAFAMCLWVGCCYLAVNSEAPLWCYTAKASARVCLRMKSTHPRCAGPGVDAFDSYGGGILPARTCSANQPARAPTANDYGDINHAMVRPPVQPDLVHAARSPTSG